MKAKKSRTASTNKRNTPFFASKNQPGFFGAQAKLTVGQPGDKYEVEADNVAERVLNHSNFGEQGFFYSGNSTLLQRQKNGGIQEKPLTENIAPLVQMQEEEEKLIQPQPIEEEEELLQPQLIDEEEEKLQPKSDTLVKEPTAQTEKLLAGNKGNGSPLDPVVRTLMENSFGSNFERVKIHTNSDAVQLNQQLGAQAFTLGNDVYFNKGKYSPGSRKGKHLLAHELTHTIQQSSGIHSINESTISREISTPLETHVENADTSKDVAFQVNQVNIVVQPDSRTESDKMENRAETTCDISNARSPEYSFENDRITAIGSVPVPTITIHTVYGRNTTATSESAYGRGTTEANVEAGNTSLGFHEGSHGTDFLNYITNNPVPVFTGAIGMTVADFKTAVTEYLDAWDAYSRAMGSFSETLTDCIGTQADFCSETP